ncbi:HAD-IA family hydrolase [Actinoallomurus purpureus]|uniref:HAD family hydrolase n=1 Tax=Actinoallomurus purpureus TaxID=478114 RepID=UPI002093E4B9|nr:HAD-IA family hydrolase [Actinoallomurus purpureus]MCO6007506.1 HAD-IA family hydrolase [Actinoallomurus purpureus]
MGFAAVIFDFFGTLTVAATRAERAEAVHATARLIGASPEEFRTAWWATWPERCTGRFGTPAETLALIAARIGVRPDEDQIAAAVELRRELEAGFCRLRADTLPTLRALRERGTRIGLISDCTHELPDCWPRLRVAPYVDAAVFSVLAGVKKPDPEIYRLAAEALDVRPADCLYVGDGGSNELTGAEAFGMTAIKILDEGGVNHRFETDPWHGPHLTSLVDVLTSTCRSR